MQAATTPNKLQRLFRFCLILVGLFFVIDLIIGSSLNTIHREIKEAEEFLELAEDVKPNFEKSLNMYTESVETAIEYIETLRPDSESDYIGFISSVEEIGQKLSLSVRLESLGTSKNTSSYGNTLNYRIQFYGGRNDLIAFLEELEALPYYIRVSELHYDSFEFLSSEEKRLVPNIELTLSLYVQ